MAVSEGPFDRQFEEALTVLLGPKAGGLSPATVRRLVEVWQDERKRCQGRGLSLKRYVYVWADGVYFSPRLEHERQCILVVTGADASGKKELLAIDDGFRESEQSWQELLVRLLDENGPIIDPELATGDRALGFWKAARKIWPSTQQLRLMLHDASTGTQDRECPELSAEVGSEKRPRAICTRSIMRRAAPAPRRRSIASLPSMGRHTKRRVPTWPRIARPCWPSTTCLPSIGSTSATVRLRTNKTKGCLSRDTALAMVFKLVKSAERHWRRLNGTNRLGEIIEGVKLRDGEPIKNAEDHAAA